MDEKFDIRGAIIQTVARQGYIEASELAALLRENGGRMPDVATKAYTYLTRYNQLRWI